MKAHLGWIREMTTNHGELIVLYPRGRLGNRMFQLALGNILAKCLDRTLCVQGKISLLSKERIAGSGLSLCGGANCGVRSFIVRS